MHTMVGAADVPACIANAHGKKSGYEHSNTGDQATSTSTTITITITTATMTTTFGTRFWIFQSHMLYVTGFCCKVLRR